jgi:hypothetical protein
MRIFLFLAVLFISLSFTYKLVSFLVFKNKQNKGEVIFIKQPGYKFFNKFYFFGGIAASVAGFVFYRIYEFEYIIVLWNILALTQILNSFISPDGYFVFSKNGIRRHYNEKRIGWELIKRVEINANEFTFYTKKAAIKAILNSSLVATQIKNLIKDKRNDVYERLFDS